MHPLGNEGARPGRSRSTSLADNTMTPMPAIHQPPQMTYFLADEKTMEASLSHSSLGHARPRENMNQSNFGVESLETTVGFLSGEDNDEQDASARNVRSNWKRGLTRGLSRKTEEDLPRSRSTSPQSSRAASRDLSPSEPRPRRSPKPSCSLPRTPITVGSSVVGSVASSPSCRNSGTDFFTDDVASQAIQSSGDEERDMPSEIMDSSSSQLVMPSIMMPSRRPFTEKGKFLGKLKVLIAGDSGVGKTSLIKSMVQLCEDIVHVDPIFPMPLSIPETLRRSSKSKRRNGKVDQRSTPQITEVYASTRAYPHWRSDFDNGRLLRRRKSTGDSVLERNICFVDTPGYGSGISAMECITPVVQYVESQVERSLGAGVVDGEVINLLCGNGGSQVDVVLYVILNRVKPVDIEYLRRLFPLTNIIPLVAHADTLLPEQLQLLKANIISELQAANIHPFLFGASPEDALTSSRPLPPFTISTATTSDQENMDASLLMSPDYVQPLILTELSVLVEQIFDHDNICWLRQVAAKKCLQWRKGISSNSSIPQSLSTKTSHLLFGSSQAFTPPIGATDSFALARITDHTLREERLAQVRLSKWASDLQRSLQNERARFEALARGERAVWLTERLNECVQDGSIVPLSEDGQRSGSPSEGALARRGPCSRRSVRGMSLDIHDPLGLMHLKTQMKRRGWTAIQIMGSFGVIGALAIWWARTRSPESEPAWGFEWAKLIMDW